jgi:hypothetical protein
MLLPGNSYRESEYWLHESALRSCHFETLLRERSWWTGRKMKTIIFAALGLAIGGSAGQAGELAALPRTEGARFAAMSLTKDQGMRAIVSNVLAPANGTHLAPCQVQVRFFDADGSLIGDATTVQLKAGESTSVSASNPSKLLRATVNIGDVGDTAKLCLLKTSVEIFDVQTGMTFVSIPGESIDGNSERDVSASSVLRTDRKYVSERKNPTPVATSTMPSRGMVSPRISPAVLAATPPTAPR